MKRQSTPKLETSYFEKENPIGWLITKVSAKFEKEFFERLTLEKPFSSITTSDHRILRFLAANIINSNDIAREAGVSKQAISKSISSLEKRGFIIRKESKEDGRSHSLLLTEKGVKLVSKAVQVAEELDRAAVKKLGAKDLNSLKQFLTKILQVSG